MELVKSRFNVKCEIGACRNQADYSVKIKRLGIRNELHLCNGCLNELYTEIGKTLVPKSPKNALGGYLKNEVVGEIDNTSTPVRQRKLNKH